MVISPWIYVLGNLNQQCWSSFNHWPGEKRCKTPTTWVATRRLGGTTTGTLPENMGGLKTKGYVSFGWGVNHLQLGRFYDTSFQRAEASKVGLPEFNVSTGESPLLVVIFHLGDLFGIRFFVGTVLEAVVQETPSEGTNWFNPVKVGELGQYFSSILIPDSYGLNRRVFPIWGFLKSQLVKDICSSLTVFGHLSLTKRRLPESDRFMKSTFGSGFKDDINYIWMCLKVRCPQNFSMGCRFLKWSISISMGI